MGDLVIRCEFLTFITFSSSIILFIQAEDSNAIAVYRGANIVGFVKATEAAGISPHWDMLNAQLLGQNKKMICTAVMLGGNRFGGDISATFSKAAL